MKPTRTRRSRPALVLALLLVASLALAACGSSSSSTPTTTAAAAAATTPGKGPARFAALRECLKKEGIELPQRKAGQTGKPGAGGGFFGGGAPGGAQLPKGVTQAQFQAALKKCGGGFRRGGFGGRFSSATYKKALASFVKCMSSNGITLPTPNTSGKGPVFDTSKVNVNTSQFKTAESKCSSLLRFARPGAGTGAGAGAGAPGGYGTPPGGGAPPAGEGAPPAGEGAPGA
jgi:hypothetical protein